VTLRIIDPVLTDRGSRYAVAGGPAVSRAEAEALVADLKRDRRYAKATHNSWGVILPDGPLKADDGEAGAGAVILRMLERADCRGQVVIVTRWFGGVKLGGDRFRNVQAAVRAYLAETGAAG
jgi:putative IMPACT (imprinted ancient) family translation regulator